MKAGPDRLGAAAGYQHIEKTTQAKTDGEWWARWEQGGARLTIRFKAAAGTEVLTGVGPGRDPADRIPVVIVRRRAASTVFECVHEFA
jgi:hypothetical protein